MILSVIGALMITFRSMYNDNHRSPYTAGLNTYSNGNIFFKILDLLE